MKEFIRRTLFFLIPIAVIAVGMEMLLRNIPNDYSYKKEYLDDHASEIEILILGNSHAHSSFNPEYFTRKAFNAGYVSQSLDCDYAILKKYYVYPQLFLKNLAGK